MVRGVVRKIIIVVGLSFSERGGREADYSVFILVFSIGIERVSG